MSEPGAPRGPYRTGIARRRQIIQSAAEVFATYGYRGGSLRQIAHAVGVTPAALTRHFDRKEDLLTEVLAYWRQQTELLTDGGASGLAFFIGLRRVVEYHLDHRGYLELFLTLSTEATDPEHPAAEFIRTRYATMIASFRAQVGAAVAAGETRPMSPDEIDREARALVAYLDGIELQWLLDPSIDLLAQFDHTLAVTLRSWAADQAAATTASTASP